MDTNERIVIRTFVSVLRQWTGLLLVFYSLWVARSPRVELNLRQQGNRITGTQRSRWEDGRGRVIADGTDRITGTVRGNQLTIRHDDGEQYVFTLSNDQQTISTIVDGERHTVQRQNP